MSNSMAKGRRKSVKRTLASMVLAFEAFIIFFATLFVFGTNQEQGPLIWTIGLSFAFLLIATPAVLGSPWSYWWGSSLQVAMLATAFWAPLMWVIGFIFIGLWVWGLIAGATIDKAKEVIEESGIDLEAELRKRKGA